MRGTWIPDGGGAPSVAAVGPQPALRILATAASGATVGSNSLQLCMDEYEEHIMGALKGIEHRVQIGGCRAELDFSVGVLLEALITHPLVRRLYASGRQDQAEDVIKNCMHGLLTLLHSGDLARAKALGLVPRAVEASDAYRMLMDVDHFISKISTEMRGVVGKWLTPGRIDKDTEWRIWVATVDRWAKISTLMANQALQEEEAEIQGYEQAWFPQIQGTETETEVVVDADELDALSQVDTAAAGQSMEVIVKNTFIEVVDPLCGRRLQRSMSAPALLMSFCHPVAMTDGGGVEQVELVEEDREARQECCSLGDWSTTAASTTAASDSEDADLMDGDCCEQDDDWTDGDLHENSVAPSEGNLCQQYHEKDTGCVEGAYHEKDTGGVEGAYHEQDTSCVEGACHEKGTGCAEGAYHEKDTGCVEGAYHVKDTGCAEGAYHEKDTGCVEGAYHEKDTGCIAGAYHEKDTGCVEGAYHEKDTGCVEDAYRERDTGCTEGAYHQKHTGCVEGACHERGTGCVEGAYHEKDTGCVEEFGHLDSELRSKILRAAEAPLRWRTVPAAREVLFKERTPSRAAMRRMRRKGLVDEPQHAKECKRH